MSACRRWCNTANDGAVRSGIARPVRHAGKVRGLPEQGAESLWDKVNEIRAGAT